MSDIYYETGFDSGYNKGRAESEDKIAALQSQVAILEESNKGYQRTAQTILEIKSERDALLALGRKWHTMPVYDLHQPTLTYCANEIEALLFTPASGESERNVMDGGKRWPKGM